MSHSLADNSAIFKLIYVILGLKGYSNEDITTNLQDFDEEKVTMAKNGIEFTIYKLEYNDESSHISMSGIDTMKLDINKLDFNKSETPTPTDPSNTNNSSTNISNPSNDVNNPQTGYETYIITSLLIFLVLFIFLKLKKSKNYFSKI